MDRESAWLVFGYNLMGVPAYLLLTKEPESFAAAQNHGPFEAMFGSIENSDDITAMGKGDEDGNEKGKDQHDWGHLHLETPSKNRQRHR